MIPQDMDQLKVALDHGLSKSLELSGRKITCGKGCSHCCYEPVYACRSDVLHILTKLDREQKETLKEKLKAWMEVFIANGQDKIYRPKIYDYMPLRLGCVFLTKEGFCQVYPHRPLECRFHAAFGPAENCAALENRKNQLFLTSPETAHAVDNYVMQGITPYQLEYYDHLCVVLSNELLGTNYITPNRVEMRPMDGNLVVVEFCTEEQHRIEQERFDESQKHIIQVSDAKI
jgi:Fe-S-cluster containining protein